MLNLLTPPAAEPIVWDDVKGHLRLDSELERDRIERVLIPGARTWCESYTARQMMTATYELKLSEFPCDGVIRIPWPPLQSVTTVKYLDSAGVLQTFASTNYVVSAPSGPFALPGSITLAFGTTWPAILRQENAVVVTFVAGYVLATNPIPAQLQQAMLIMVDEFFDRRGQQTIGEISAAGAVTAELLAKPFIAPSMD
jgi:uncharacterized phiE125 gp8 family phage protein